MKRFRFTKYAVTCFYVKNIILKESKKLNLKYTIYKCTLSISIIAMHVNNCSHITTIIGLRLFKFKTVAY